MSRPRLFCLNRCLVVRKGIAEMVADASTHAVMYQVEGTRRYTTIRLPTNPNMFFTTFIAYFRVWVRVRKTRNIGDMTLLFSSFSLSSAKNLLSFQNLSRAIRIRITEIRRSILPPMENTSITSFLTRFCLKVKQKNKRKFHD